MKTTFNKATIIASLAIPLLTAAGAAHAGLITSDQRSFPRPVQASSVYDAQASINVPEIANDARSYQGGPKTGTGFSR